MKLLTNTIREQLLRNGRIRQALEDQPVPAEAGRNADPDFLPVVKLFTPDAGCTWLLSELDPEDPDIAFGLCDLGLGCPELGSVRLSELESVRGRFGLPVERDRYFRPSHTFRQAKELGGHVRKGEKGELVVYANTLTRTETDEKTGEEVEHAIPFMKGYTVFNAEQIEGLPADYYQLAEPVLDPVQRIEHAENFFAATRADIRHGGNQAYYAIGSDRIQMPPFEAFRDAESYYATLAHESTHWTRHPSRLDRDFGRKRFGDEGYAREELVAELGSAFLAADLELTPEAREDHNAYIASWLKVLADDKRAIFTAAAHAQRAVDFLHGLQDRAAETAAA
jgi:antirestriction protein ArdC